MATFTHLMAEEALQHVVSIVFDLQDTHPIVLMMEQDGIKEIMDLLSLSPTVIYTYLHG